MEFKDHILKQMLLKLDYVLFLLVSLEFYLVSERISKVSNALVQSSGTLPVFTFLYF